jgi:hypothetical protein
MEENQFLIICVLHDSHSILVRVTPELLDIHHHLKDRLHSQNPKTKTETRNDILHHQQEVCLFHSGK